MTEPKHIPVPALPAGERWRAAPWPGEIKPFESAGKHAGYTIACPCCTATQAVNTTSFDAGQRGPFWIESGSLEAGTLTLDPSIICTACDWHGYLRDNVFVPV